MMFFIKQDDIQVCPFQLYANLDSFTTCKSGGEEKKGYERPAQPLWH